MRIMGSKDEYSGSSRMFNKKIVNGKVEMLDTELTEANIKLHNKQFSVDKQYYTTTNANL